MAFYDELREIESAVRVLQAQWDNIEPEHARNDWLDPIYALVQRTQKTLSVSKESFDSEEYASVIKRVTDCFIVVQQYYGKV